MNTLRRISTAIEIKLCGLNSWGKSRWKTFAKNTSPKELNRGRVEARFSMTGRRRRDSADMAILAVLGGEGCAPGDSRVKV